jgi:hypothetical protein
MVNWLGAEEEMMDEVQAVAYRTDQPPTDACLAQDDETGDANPG